MISYQAICLGGVLILVSTSLSFSCTRQHSSPDAALLCKTIKTVINEVIQKLITNQLKLTVMN